MAKTEKLIEQVAGHLRDGETVLASVPGSYVTVSLGSETLKAGIFIATESRIIFYGERWTGFDFESFEYRNITSFEHSKQFMGNVIQFSASGSRIAMKRITDAVALLEFVTIVNEKLGPAHAVQAVSPAAPTIDGGDVIDQIRRLGELRDAGIVTPEEFEAKKAELLARL